MWRYDGDIESVEYCVLCDSTSFEEDIVFAKKLGLINPFSCKKCSQCGLRWLSPRPTQRGYELVYTMDNYFGGEHSPENFAVLEDSRKEMFRDRLKRIGSYCSSGQKTLLDIGAATGQFVHEARNTGFDAKGIELSAEAREEAIKKYSINLSGDSLKDLFLQGYRFDVIHMNHVFEHVLEPDKCLQECNNLLNKNGLLVIEVPQQFYNDLDRLKILLLMSKKPSFTTYSLHHTYFYTPNTLTSLLKRYNFSVCGLRTANLANTPLSPPNYKNFILAFYLFFSDKIHKGGNIIELFSFKK